MISPGALFFLFFVFYFFFFFVSFFGGGAVGDKRTKNGLILQKNSVCCTSYLRIHISYNCHLWYACVKWWYLQVFFFSFFFKILILWVVREGVGFSLLRGGEKFNPIKPNKNSIFSCSHYCSCFFFVLISYSLDT